MLHRFVPIMRPGYIDSPNDYDYVPSVVDGRIFWCAGLGTDTIVSVNLDNTWPSKPFILPNKLVADPSAVRTPYGFMVYFTIGKPDGTRNGVGWLRMTTRGKILNHGLLIPQSKTPKFYGTGQPTVIPVPGHKYLVIVRDDNPVVTSCLRAFEVSSLTGNTVLGELSFYNGPEDGVSPDGFWFEGKLWLLLTALNLEGQGFVGLRSYTYNSETKLLRRDVEKEEKFTSGNVVFYANTAVPVTDGIDGGGIVRNKSNDPKIQDGNLIFWRGTTKGDRRNPDWVLRSGRIPFPNY